jgi:hypothetical protein
VLTAVELTSGTLAGLISVLVTIVILALIVARMMKRDQRIRVARIGVFVQRERIDEMPYDLHSIDPLDAESDTRPAPLPPPTPPPPLPPRPDDADEATWPQRPED